MKQILFLFLFAICKLHLVACNDAAKCIDEVTCQDDKNATNTNTNTCSETNNLEEEVDFISEAGSIEIDSPAPDFMDANRLGADIGVPQVIDQTQAQESLDKIMEARRYIQEEVMVEAKYEKVRSSCKNNHESCTFWSLIGECENNPGYMQLNCGPVCHSCEMLHVETRCPMDPDAIDALYPGDLNKLFQRIITDPSLKQYEPVVVSKPPEGPWMVMFENVLSEEEANRLIEVGGEIGYDRSADVGQRKDDGTHDNKIHSGRTSTNAWCFQNCAEDPLVSRVIQRIENITGIPEPNSEALQLLRYEQDQFYQTHSDYIPFQIDRPCGVRILTFYMYLNEVEEGGGTHFPHLNLTVTPKRGRAALWPSVLNDKPNQKDYRTNHQAMPVIKGVKYGANAWLHQRDYKTPNKLGC